MSVSDGQAADAVNFNAAFVSKSANSTMTAILDLFNTADVNSGARVQNVQQAITELWNAVGITSIGDTGRNNYSSNNYVVDGTSRKAAIEALDVALAAVVAADKVVTQGGVSTNHAIPRYVGTDGKTIQNSTSTIDDSGNMSVGGDLTVAGDFHVDGTTTTTSSDHLDVTNQTISVNDGGDDVSADGSGLKVDRTGTDGAFLFDSTLASKWKLGLLGSEHEVVDVFNIQTLISKTMDGDDNTITNLTDAAIKAGADIDRTKLANGNPDYVVINAGDGSMSSEQFLDKSRGGTGQDNTPLLFPASGEIETKPGPYGSFQFANNTADQNITGLIFDKTIYRSVKVEWSAYRKSTGGGGQIRVQCGSFYMIHDDTNWALTDGPMSTSPAGVTFDVIASTGQAKISSDDNGGTFSAPASVLKFKTVNVTVV